jgi:energy-coupling factor transport system substrate-specific component
MNTLAIVLIPVCIAIDWAGHALAKALNLLFLDSIGTVLGGLLAGPWVGGISGLLTNVLSSGSTDPIAWAYCGVAFAIGIAAGIGGYYGWQRTWPGRVALYVLIVLVASVISTPINLGLYQGQSGVPFGDALYTGMVKSGWPQWLAAYIDEASGDIPDKFITVVAAILIYYGLPNRYRSLFILWKRPATEAEPAPAPVG